MSILTSIKKLLGIAEDYEHFDQDIIIHINSVFMILRQLGIGPEKGFSINDKSTTWKDYVSDLELIESVKTYVYLKVRLIFDPPTGGVLEAIKETIQELEWRLNVQAETYVEKIQNGMFISKERITDFLYELSYDKLDYDYAKEYFKSITDISLGACTSVRSGNVYGRNFDWFYNNQVEFIVNNKRSSIDKRLTFSSIGVAGGIKDLTTDFVKSNKESDLYKVLPFQMMDGINECGVIANYNVVPLDYGKNKIVKASIESKEEINALMLVRFILDIFSSAKSAVEYIKDYVDVTFPKALHDMGYELHLMVADSNNTYAIEFIEGQTVVIDISEKPIMTNFHLSNVEFNEDGSVYTPDTQTDDANAHDTNKVTLHGSGLERYNLCIDREDIEDLLEELSYSKTYTDGKWLTEFVDGDLTVKSNPIDFIYILSKAKEYWSEKDRSNPKVWISTHQSLYSINERSLVIKSQEQQRTYTFYL